MPPVLFENISGLWALLSLLPLILLYLIRPKPKLMAIPSLMFFMQSTGANKLTSFLKQFITDWLFLIQLLVLLSLAFVLAKPFSTYTHDVTAKNTILLLDVSASSQVNEGGATRFEIGRRKAIDVLASKNTIVLAKDVPLIGIKDASYDEARKYLEELAPRDTQTRLGEALILAGEALGNNEGRVVVISDFINTGGQDVDIAKGVLQSKGIIVDFITTAGSNRHNVGFVDVISDEAQATVYVKNFDDVERKVGVVVGNTRKDLTIPSLATDTFSFQTPEGITRAYLDLSDDLAVDNELFISAPSRIKTRVLLITNNESIFLKNALLSSGLVELTVAEPPIVPKERYDVYVIHNVAVDQILPGTFEDIAAAVEKGSTVVVHAQEESDRIDYKGVIPIRFVGRLDTAPVVVEQLNRFTKNAEFGQLGYLFLVQKTAPMLTVTSADNSTVVGISKIGLGKSVYYGILEKASDFKFSPSYPIFWTEVIKYVTDQQDMKTLNYKTGDTLIFDSPTRIETPSRTLKQVTLVLEDTGVYTVDGKKVVANLVNERESDINSKGAFGTKSVDFELKPVKEERKYYWERLLVAGALILLLAEVAYVKRRGDL
ncbi:VWA domain-containing protein [Candidatus Woesearchaeota archaeon]|nr:VWA domain-containing protein [Candidatus Woesearchaeota archaeon]